jgi:hypothetical protein
MAHKNRVIKTDYTIDIAGAIQDEYYSLSLRYDFNDSTIDQLPAGWVAQDSDGAQVKSRITGDDTTNRALLIRGLRIPHGSVDNPPITSSNYRWVVLSETFKNPITVKFKAYEGRDSGGEYSATENPDIIHDEFLWLQYKVGSAAWQTAGAALVPGQSPVGGTWNLNSVITRYIDSGVNADNPISLRWIHKTNASEPQTDVDIWAIDDIEVYELPTSTAPKRLTFLGAPNLRLQTPENAYKTFLGKRKL